MRPWVLATAVATLLCVAAAPSPSARPQEQERQAQQAKDRGDAQADSGRGPSTVEREALVVDREANRIAEGANRIARAGLAYSLWQLAIGIGGFVLTAVAAGAAIAAALYAKHAADAAQKGLAQDAGQSVRELRAYISATPNFMVAFAEGHIMSARFRVLNHGSTPAHDLRLRGRVIVAPFPFKPRYKLPPIQKVKMALTVLFPGAEVTGHCVSTTKVTVADILRIIGRTGVICVFGEVTYKDAFMVKRSTRFCQFVTGNDALLNNLTTAYKAKDLEVGFAAAPIGNSYD